MLTILNWVLHLGTPRSVKLTVQDRCCVGNFFELRVQLQLNNSAANCNGSRKHAFMDALFDNVMVNP